MFGISVIIPTYNRAHLIGDTLKSLLNQTFPADEIILVDDGSTDDTSNAAHAAFEQWKGGHVKSIMVPEFKVIRQDNEGPAKARNTGFAASHGEFIHFFDSDDLAAPNKHEVQLTALQQTGADISYGPWMKGCFSEGKFTPESHVLQQGGLPDGDLIKILLTQWSIVPHACLFRRSIIEKVGGFPEHLFVAEDQMLFLNCLLAGARVVHSPGTLELYRTDDSGKITAVGEGQKRHAAHWARFLVDAEAVCKQDGVSPQKWIGFRKRVWEALQDLERFGVEDSNLKTDLRALLQDSTPECLYSILSALERKWIGFHSRLTGSRASPSFKSGPPTKEQMQLIEMMGLNLV